MVAGLDSASFFHYNIRVIGVWRSLVSRLVRVQEASGSNPDTPTKIPESAFAGSGIFFVSGFERPAPVRRLVQKVSGGHFLGRGRIHYSIDAPLVGVDME